MKAYASVPENKMCMARDIPQPMVFVNGSPEKRLLVREYRRNAPLDEHTVLLTSPISQSNIEGNYQLISKWLNNMVTIALPMRLNDDTIRWSILASGKLRRIMSDRAPACDKQYFELTDQWSDCLSKAIEQVWWRTSNGILVASHQRAELGIGRSSNRSGQINIIAGQSVHVLTENGSSWTVKTALHTVSAFAGLNISTNHLPAGIALAPLVNAVDLSQPLRKVLKHICEPYGLVINRQLTGDPLSTIERRSVRAVDSGRRIKLSWAKEDQPASHVLRVDRERPVDQSQLLIAETNGWRVESTFDLVKGWDLALEGMDDIYYDKLQSEDFTTYKQVYRLWALNEDGFFTGEPFNQGPAFDLTGLFNGESIHPQPLQFLRCLKLDSYGELTPAVIQISTNAGVDWTDYSDKFEVNTKFAAVYLNDSTLPAEFLTAAKLGDARVRITASLQSPKTILFRRWMGNPFAGCKPEKVFHMGNTFVFQRVSTDSINYQEVQGNSFAAEQVDQSAYVRAWLLERSKWEKTVPAVDPGQATLTLADVNTMLNVGDRLENIGGQGIDGHDHSQAIVGGGAMIEQVICRWPSLAKPNEGKGFQGQPQTVVKLRF